MTRHSYHHGDLPAVILAEAARLVAERGAERVSLRELARCAGVSHAAPAHHFTDRRGLFTALATQGFELLTQALADARGDFADAALAYVQFALDHPGHYQVMFNRSLLDASDGGLAAAEAAAGAELSHWRRGRWCTVSPRCGSTTPSTPRSGRPIRWTRSGGSRRCCSPADRVSRRRAGSAASGGGRTPE